MNSVCDLAIYLDSDTLMKTQVSKTMSSCFAVLRQLRSIHRSVKQEVTQPLIVSLLDFDNSVLAGLPSNVLDRMQSVMNDAACVNSVFCSAEVYARHPTAV